MAESGEDKVQVTFAFDLPQFDGFHREVPAHLEEPQHVWVVAREAIDFAGALLLARTTPRPGKQLRDTVLVALLRRAAVTAESIVLLLRHGLLEPAVCSRRTLQEIEVSIRLVVADPGDRMAKRLAAFHYLSYRRHGEDLLTNPTTRAEHADAEGVPERLRSVTKSYAKFLGEELFAEVRNDLGKSRHWHGYDTVQKAFAAADSESDYLNTYDSATSYVHASNLDADFVDRQGTELRIKPLVERDPATTHLFLGETLFALHRILRLLLQEHPESRFTESSKPDDATHLDAVSGLGVRLLEAFEHVPALGEKAA